MPPCDGSGVIGWNDDAYENIECPGCPKCSEESVDLVGHREQGDEQAAGERDAPDLGDLSVLRRSEVDGQTDERNQERDVGDQHGVLLEGKSTPCRRCGALLHLGEGQVLVAMSANELEEAAYAVPSAALCRRLSCALGLLDVDRERAVLEARRECDQ